MNIEEQKAKPRLMRLRYLNLHPLNVYFFLSSTGDEKKEAINLNSNFFIMAHVSTVQNGAH